MDISILQELLKTYAEKLEHHKEMVKTFDRDENWVDYMAERTMEAYCRGYVSALQTSLDVFTRGEKVSR